jgi:hypothetical protein
MPVPDFSPGEVLTASAMDSIGLWRVASGPLSGTATNFVGCFTSDYTNYRIVIDGITFNTTGDVYIQFLDGSTPNATLNYQWAYSGLLVTGTNAPSDGSGQTVGYTGTTVSAAFNQTMASIAMDVFAPQSAAQRKFVAISASGYGANFYVRNGMVQQNQLLAFDGIRFLTASAATFTGNVTIYGYRKP